jgi:hypothetical protein
VRAAKRDGRHFREVPIAELETARFELESQSEGSSVLTMLLFQFHSYALDRAGNGERRIHPPTSTTFMDEI